MKSIDAAPRVAVRLDKKTKEPILFFREDCRPGFLGCYARIGEHSEASEEYYYYDTRAPGSDEERIVCNELVLFYQSKYPIKLVTRLPRRGG